MHSSHFLHFFSKYIFKVKTTKPQINKERPFAEYNRNIDLRTKTPFLSFFILNQSTNEAWIEIEEKHWSELRKERKQEIPGNSMQQFNE